MATDTRLWLYKQLGLIQASLHDLIRVSVDRAEADVDVLMPGFTHLQVKLVTCLHCQEHLDFTHLQVRSRDAVCIAERKVGLLHSRRDPPGLHTVRLAEAAPAHTAMLSMLESGALAAHLGPACEVPQVASILYQFRFAN